MQILDQGMVFTAIERVSVETVRAISMLQSHREEAAAILTVDAASFLVRSCEWEIMRADAAADVGAGSVPDMIGVEAYFDAGAAIRALAGVPEKIRELLRDCVRGMIQAELYLHRERGYTDVASYDRFFDEYYTDTCRYYSYLDRRTCPFYEHAGDYVRKKNLFNRYKHHILEREREAPCATVSGSFHDSFHELGAELVFDVASGRIVTARSQFIRAPGPVCYEMDDMFAALEGERLAELDKKRIASFLGGGEGCFHLVDLTHALVVCAAGAFRGQWGRPSA